MAFDSTPENSSDQQCETQTDQTKSRGTEEAQNRDSLSSVAAAASWSVTITRAVLGGVLMGLANLLPGISGGTMLLATGIYPTFVQSISDLTRFRFSQKSVAVVATVAFSAGLAILLLAGLLRDLVLDNRWIMYSLFIGLTLGGLPLVWKMARPINRSVLLASGVALIGMAVLVGMQIFGYAGGTSTGILTMFLAGILGAGAMILPGLSGAYLLILLGQYLPILSAIDNFKNAVKERDVSVALESVATLLPVAVGVAMGVVLVSNLLKWMLQRYEKATLGILIGLLLGSVLGLYPFQIAVPPEFGGIIKGQMVTAENIDSIKQKDWLIAYQLPDLFQIGCSLGLIGLGYAITACLALVGKTERV